MSWQQSGFPRARPRSTSEEGEVDEEGEIRSRSPPGAHLPPQQPQQGFPPPPAGPPAHSQHPPPQQQPPQPPFPPHGPPRAASLGAVGFHSSSHGNHPGGQQPQGGGGGAGGGGGPPPPQMAPGGPPPGSSLPPLPRRSASVSAPGGSWGGPPRGGGPHGGMGAGRFDHYRPSGGAAAPGGPPPAGGPPSHPPPPGNQAIPPAVGRSQSFSGGFNRSQQGMPNKGPLAPQQQLQHRPSDPRFRGGGGLGIGEGPARAHSVGSFPPVPPLPFPPPHHQPHHHNPEPLGANRDGPGTFPSYSSLAEHQAAPSGGGHHPASLADHHPPQQQQHPLTHHPSPVGSSATFFDGSSIAAQQPGLSVPVLGPGAAHAGPPRLPPPPFAGADGDGGPGVGGPPHREFGPSSRPPHGHLHPHAGPPPAHGPQHGGPPPMQHGGGEPHPPPFNKFRRGGRGGGGGSGGGPMGGHDPSVGYYGPQPQHQSPTQHVGGRPRFRGDRGGRSGSGGMMHLSGDRDHGGGGGRFGPGREAMDLAESAAAAAAHLPDGPPSSHLPGSDAFTRARDWAGGGQHHHHYQPHHHQHPRGSPQGSPRGMRKPIDLSSPDQQPGGGPSQQHDRPHPQLPPPPLSAAASAPVPTESPAGASRMTDEPKPGPAAPPRLTTRDLGEDDAARGDGAVGILADVLKNPDLLGGGELPPELPNKQLIFRALAMMDSRIKEAQRGADTAAETVDTAKSELSMAGERANQARAQEALRNEVERKRLDGERREQAELARGLALESMLRERQVEFDAEEAERYGTVKSDLDSLKREKECVLKRDATKRSTEQTQSVEVILSTKREEMERVLAESVETEAERAVVETQLSAKLAGASDGTCDRSAAPPATTQDVVATILAANRKLASEAHLLAFSAGIASGDAIVDEPPEPPSSTGELENARDPKEGKTSAEWAQLSQQVTGLADALYSEPSEAPYYEHNEKTHALIAPLVKEYIRDQKSRLEKHWSDLAEEYEYRRKSYNRLMKKRNKGRKQRKSSSVAVRHSILGNKPGAVILESTGGRTSTNPYRRARRGNEVRSEYEQEQIIAEIAAKEAMEKKIHFGGSKIPRQVGQLERELTARFVNTFTAQLVDDLDAQAREESLINPWTDMEKCIYLDRFMQHPKDFRKISSFLRNKSTKDCVAFYYNSKKTIPYKSALREHNMRRKRRGDYHVWDATIEAAIACGAVIEAGPSEEKPLLFFLPSHDRTFSTYALHPIKREMFDEMEIDENTVKAYEEQVESQETLKKSGSKRKREPLFTLEPEKRRFLRSSSPETVEMKLSPSRASLADTEATEASFNEKGDVSEAAGGPASRRAPQKWSNTEKRVFVETLEKHGRNWSLLAEAVGTKTISQIKNFYYDFKKQSGKLRPDAKKPPRSEASARARRREEDASTPTPTVREPLAETPMDVTREQSTPRTPWGVEESQLASSVQPHRGPQPQIPTTEELLSREQQEEMFRHQQRSRSSTPEGLTMAERWLHMQHQSLMQQQSQSTEEAALRLQFLHQHHQRQQQHHHHHNQPHGSHHQQLLSNLIPWMAGTSGVVDYANAAGSLRDWEQLSNAQQLQHLLQQRHQHHLPQHLSPLRHHQHQPHLQQASNPFASIGAHSQLGGAAHPLSAASQLRAARGMAGAGGFNSAALELALAHQQAQQGGSAGAGPSSDVSQLALAQQMMAFQGANNSADGTTTLTADALALLQRAMGNQHRPFGGGSGPPSDR